MLPFCSCEPGLITANSSGVTELQPNALDAQAFNLAGDAMVAGDVVQLTQASNSQNGQVCCRRLTCGSLLVINIRSGSCWH